MKIFQLTPGSGDNFYCENCLRDAAIVSEMRQLGHEVLMIPMYLPLQADKESPVSNAPIFFGGINVYLQQKWSLFRRTPRWLDSLFDAKWLLHLVGKAAGMTSSKDLGETTLSMLRGRDGKQLKELDRLIDFLEERQDKPDVVCISNALLAGLAGAVKSRLDVPIVCLLQDEDAFLDGLGEPYSEKAWQVVREKAADIDFFVPVSDYYSKVMQDRLGIRGEKFSVVHTGVSTEQYQRCVSKPDTPAIGYLSRMCPDKGLDILVDGFIILKRNEKFRDVRLIIAGGRSSNDIAFINSVKCKIEANRLSELVDFLGDFGTESKLDFFRSISVLSVPEKKAVSCGLYAVEAMAAGVPVVQPASGVFVELQEMTGGGCLYEPNDASSLAAAMEIFLADSDYAYSVGQKARKAVCEKLDISQTAKKMARIYNETARQYNNPAK